MMDRDFIVYLRDNYDRIVNKNLHKMIATGLNCITLRFKTDRGIMDVYLVDENYYFVAVGIKIVVPYTDSSGAVGSYVINKTADKIEIHTSTYGTEVLRKVGLEIVVEVDITY